MSALTADLNLQRRGPPASGVTFGYPVAAGEKVFKGSIVGVNAAGSLQRPQTAGTVALVGVSDRNLDNTAGASVSAVPVEAMRDANYRVDRDTDKQTPEAAATWLANRIGR